MRRSAQPTSGQPGPLEAEVDIDNAPAQKAHGRGGFAVEGRKAAARWRAGSRVDLEVTAGSVQVPGSTRDGKRLFQPRVAARPAGVGDHPGVEVVRRRGPGRRFPARLR